MLHGSKCSSARLKCRRPADPPGTWKRWVIRSNFRSKCFDDRFHFPTLLRWIFHERESFFTCAIHWTYFNRWQRCQIRITPLHYVNQILRNYHSGRVFTWNAPHFLQLRPLDRFGSVRCIKYRRCAANRCAAVWKMAAAENFICWIIVKDFPLEIENKPGLPHFNFALSKSKVVRSIHLPKARQLKFHWINTFGAN